MRIVQKIKDIHKTIMLIIATALMILWIKPWKKVDE